MNATTRLATAIAFPLAAAPAAGCASNSEGTSGDNHAQITASKTMSPAGGMAIGVLRGQGSFAFSLDESGPAAGARARCAAENAGDAAKADACYAAIRKQGSDEGLRFEVDSNGTLIFVSRGLEEGVETTYIRAPVEVASDQGASVVLRLAGKAEGTMAGNPPAGELTMRFDVPDANTIVQNDPRKGKLVFHRSQ